MTQSRLEQCFLKARPALCFLSDRLDNLVVGIGKKPKEDKDPFALRRAALGTARILLTSELSFSLNFYLSLPLLGIKSS